LAEDPDTGKELFWLRLNGVFGTDEDGEFDERIILETKTQLLARAPTTR
jgi:hypothetical protein